jgi:hypothetical protein
LPQKKRHCLAWQVSVAGPQQHDFGSRAEVGDEPQHEPRRVESFDAQFEPIPPQQAKPG